MVLATVASQQPLALKLCWPFTSETGSLSVSEAARPRGQTAAIYRSRFSRLLTSSPSAVQGGQAFDLPARCSGPPRVLRSGQPLPRSSSSVLWVCPAAASGDGCVRSIGPCMGPLAWQRAGLRPPGSPAESQPAEFKDHHRSRAPLQTHPGPCKPVPGTSQPLVRAGEASQADNGSIIEPLRLPTHSGTHLRSQHSCARPGQRSQDSGTQC